MRRNLPELFGTTYNSVLYVGANQRRQHFVSDFEAAGYERIVILEAFQANYEFLRKKFASSPPYEVIHGDVRNAEEVANGTYDVVFFWHGPEHLHSDEIGPVLAKLERMAGKVIVLGMPHGRYDQGPEYGNPYEEHLAAIYPQFLEDLGYSCETLMEADQRGSNITAWKYV